MNRVDLQLLAESWVKDAEILLNEGRWPAAYYLLGYVVECALKACASRQFGLHEVPDRKVVTDFYSHELGSKLLNISGLKDVLLTKAKVEPDFEINWKTVCDWSENSRYDPLTPETRARDMHLAVTDPRYGVFPWLKTQW